MFGINGPLAPYSEQQISGSKLGNGYGGCNGWQGGDPRTPGWKVSITYFASAFGSGSGATVTLATGRGHVQFSTDVGTDAGLSCPLDGYNFAKFGDSDEFPCQWSLN